MKTTASDILNADAPKAGERVLLPRVREAPAGLLKPPAVLPITLPRS